MRMKPTKCKLANIQMKTKTEKPPARIMQMTLTPEQVGDPLPGKTKVRMDYYFDAGGRRFAGARAWVTRQ